MQAWDGTWPNSTEPLHVVAAAYQGKPVYFRVLHPQEFARMTNATTGRHADPLSRAGLLIFVLVSIQGGGALLAWWNLRLGRGDRRGALRLSLLMFAVMMAIWALTAEHPGGLLEIAGMDMSIAEALFVAATIGLSYLAIEPFVRRLRPETLFSSARILAGRWNDPGVGRDLLVGVAAGTLIKVVADGSVLVSSLLDPTQPIFVALPYEAARSLMGSVSLIAAILDAVRLGVFLGLGILVLLLCLRLVTRHEVWAAVAVILLVSSAFTQVFPGVWYVTWFCHLFNTAAIVWMLGRLGIFATTITWFTILLLDLPITTDPSDFYFSNGLFVMLLTIGIACCGGYTSVVWRSFEVEVRTRNPIDPQP